MLNTVQDLPTKVLAIGSNLGQVLGASTTSEFADPDGASKTFQIPSEEIRIGDLYRQKMVCRVSAGVGGATLNARLYRIVDPLGVMSPDLFSQASIVVPNATGRLTVERNMVCISQGSPGTGVGTFDSPWTYRFRTWVTLTIDSLCSTVAFTDFSVVSAAGFAVGDGVGLWCKNVWAFATSNASNTVREEFGSWERLRVVS